MRHLHKKVIRTSQIILVAVAFFLLNGIIGMVLFVAGEVSLVEVLEYLEAIAGAETLSIGAMVIKIMAGKIKFEDFISYLLGLIDGSTYTEKDAIEKIKVIEREKIKSLRRK